MAKVLKNQTLSPIVIDDVGGVIIPASPSTYTIQPQDFPLWAASGDIDTFINSGDIKVNDGYDDLDSETGKKHIHEESVPRISSLMTALSVTATANTTTTFTNATRLVHVYTGSTAGQIIKLPDATTLTVGHRFQFWNISTQPITIQDNSSGAIVTLAANRRLEAVLRDNSSAAGIWVSDANIFSGVADSLSRFAASCGFDGNASTGRYLEFNSNVDSNISGFILPRTTVLKEIAFAISANSAITFTVYKFSGGVETALTSISTTSGQRTAYTTGLNILYAAGDEIRVKCTAGSAARPVFTLFMVYI